MFAIPTREITMPGPPPKRSTQRRRRNKAPAANKVAVEDTVRGPKLTGRHSAAARRFWEALRRSGQAEFYQASDWAAAELVVAAIDTFVRKPSAMMLASINSAMSNLLVTEGDRRRVRLELEQPAAAREPDVEQAKIKQLADYRKRVRSS